MIRLFNPRFLLSALLVLLTGLTAAQIAWADSANPVLSRIQQRGELVLGTSGNMPPMTHTRDDGKVVGFDIDLAELMAAGMDVKLTIKTMAFDKLLRALERGDVDVVISNITMTQKRNLRAAFVGPYMTSGKCVITKREPLARAEAAENLNSPEIRLAALSGSTSADFVRLLLPKASLTLVEDYDAAVRLINDDKLGGLLTDYPVCLAMLKRYPDAGFVSLFSLLSYEPIGIALPGNDPLLVNWTENFMTRVDEMGVLEELAIRWFGKPVAISEDK